MKENMTSRLLKDMALQLSHQVEFVDVQQRSGDGFDLTITHTDGTRSQFYANENQTVRQICRQLRGET